MVANGSYVAACGTCGCCAMVADKEGEAVIDLGRDLDRKWT